MTSDLTSAKQPVSLRTSATDPLRIDAVEYRSHVIGLTMRPGRIGRSMTGADWARNFEADMSAIKDWSPDQVICAFRSEAASPGDLSWSILQRGMSATSIRLGEDGLPANTVMLDQVLEQVRGKAAPRILVISERGLEGAGLVAGFLLRRLGLAAADAIRMINDVRVDAITCAYQRDFLEGQGSPSIPKAVPARELQPPGIIAAKSTARHIQFNDGQSRSAALEKVAQVDGWRNWSTMSAALSGPGLPYPQHNAAAAAAHEALGLRNQDPEEVIRTIDALCIWGPHNEMWTQRSRAWLRACVLGLFDLHRRCGTQVGAGVLRHALCLEGDLGFAMIFRAYLIGGLDGPGKLAVRGMADTLPGFSAERALRGERQSEKALEHAGFMSMQFTKPMGDILDWPT